MESGPTVARCAKAASNALNDSPAPSACVPRACATTFASPRATASCTCSSGVRVAIHISSVSPWRRYAATSPTAVTCGATIRIVTSRPCATGTCSTSPASRAPAYSEPCFTSSPTAPKHCACVKGAALGERVIASLPARAAPSCGAAAAASVT